MWRIACPRSHSLLINAQPHAKGRSLCAFRPTAATKSQPERPTLDDVQRLSEGRAARSRGYGSRQVPHRLNQDERQQYNIAKERGFLTLKGSGYRRERKGSPLANIWRQLNDAMGRHCVLVEQQGPNDTVLIDLSTLRLLDASQAEAAVCEVARTLGVDALPSGAHSSPFTVIVPGSSLEEDSDSDDDDDSIVEEERTELAGLMIELTEAEEHILTAPIWQQRPKIVCFECERPTAKALGKALAAWRVEGIAVVAGGKKG